MERATNAQIAYAEKLLRELGYDVEDYPLSEMSKREASRLINELKEELYGERERRWLNGEPSL